MWVFAENINQTNKGGIIESVKHELLCMCDEDKSKIILEALQCLEESKKPVLVLNDLELQYDQLDIACYHQTSVRLFEERSIMQYFVGKPVPLEERIHLLYDRLKPIHVKIKKITTSHHKNKYDRPFEFIRRFRQFEIQVSLEDDTELNVIRKVSPPLYQYILDKWKINKR